MIRAIESDLYRISKHEDYDDIVYCVEIKETGSFINVFENELNELIELLTAVPNIL